MASGDVVFETTGDGADLVEYYKGFGPREYNFKMASDDPDDFNVQLSIAGNRVGSAYPVLTGGATKYKIKITEV
jgi:hypothetical protein